ncbi:hypothetical protein V8C86DRAFT_1188960 [Haematococcus lacustris]
MVGESLISSSVGYEVVLFSSRLTHEKDGDHVDEIKLDVPCTVTQLQIVDARQPSDSAPCVLIRVFARDSGSAHAARFAPLVASEISCAAGRTVTCPTEIVLTKHIVVRGRYSQLQLTVVGFPEHDGLDAALGRGSNDLTDEDGQPLPSVAAGLSLPHLHPHHLLKPLLDSGDSKPAPSTVPAPVTTPAPVPAPSPADAAQAAAADAMRPGLPGQGLAGLLTPSLGAVLPLPNLPPRFMHGLHIAQVYFHEVHRSRSIIERNPPGDRLRGCMVAAEAVLAAVQGKPASLLRALDQPAPPGHEPVPPELWAEEATDMAVSWCGLVASPLTFQPAEMAVATAGLAVAVLLCATPVGCVTFMCGGGMHALAEVLQVPGAPADIVRLAAGLCELIITTAGPAGCEALLGWWSPPPLQARPPPLLGSPPSGLPSGHEAAGGAMEGDRGWSERGPRVGYGYGQVPPPPPPPPPRRLAVEVAAAAGAARAAAAKKLADERAAAAAAAAAEAAGKLGAALKFEGDGVREGVKAEDEDQGSRESEGLGGESVTHESVAAAGRQVAPQVKQEAGVTEGTVGLARQGHEQQGQGQGQRELPGPLAGSSGAGSPPPTQGGHSGVEELEEAEGLQGSGGQGGVETHPSGHPERCRHLLGAQDMEQDSCMDAEAGPPVQQHQLPAAAAAAMTAAGAGQVIDDDMNDAGGGGPRFHRQLGSGAGHDEHRVDGDQEGDEGGDGQLEGKLERPRNSAVELSGGGEGGDEQGQGRADDDGAEAEGPHEEEDMAAEQGQGGQEGEGVGGLDQAGEEGQEEEGGGGPDEEVEVEDQEQQLDNEEEVEVPVADEPAYQPESEEAAEGEAEEEVVEGAEGEAGIDGDGGAGEEEDPVDAPANGAIGVEGEEQEEQQQARQATQHGAPDTDMGDASEDAVRAAGQAGSVALSPASIADPVVVTQAQPLGHSSQPAGGAAGLEETTAAAARGGTQDGEAVAYNDQDEPGLGPDLHPDPGPDPGPGSDPAVTSKQDQDKPQRITGGQGQSWRHQGNPGCGQQGQRQEEASGQAAVGPPQWWGGQVQGWWQSGGRQRWQCDGPGQVSICMAAPHVVAHVHGRGGPACPRWGAGDLATRVGTCTGCESLLLWAHRLGGCGGIAWRRWSAAECIRGVRQENKKRTGAHRIARQVNAHHRYVDAKQCQ